jgi:hypothetical protein
MNVRLEIGAQQQQKSGNNINYSQVVTTNTK